MRRYVHPNCSLLSPKADGTQPLQDEEAAATERQHHNVRTAPPWACRRFRPTVHALPAGRYASPPTIRRIYLLSGAATWSTEGWSLRFADRLLPHVGWTANYH